MSPSAGSRTFTVFERASAAAGSASGTSSARSASLRAMTAEPKQAGARALVLRDHAVDEVVLRGLIGAHEVVALGVLRDLLEVLLRVLREDLVEAAAHVDDLLRV